MGRRQDVYRELASDHYAPLLAYAWALAGTREGGALLLDDAMVDALAWPHRVRSVADADHAVRVRLARRASRTATASTPPGQDADAVTAALAALDPMARACVVLRHYDGLPVARIAERLRVAPSRAASTLDAAEEALCATLGVTRGEVGESVVVAPHGRRR